MDTRCTAPVSGAADTIAIGCRCLQRPLALHPYSRSHCVPQRAGTPGLYAPRPAPRSSLSTVTLRFPRLVARTGPFAFTVERGDKTVCPFVHSVVGAGLSPT